MASNWLAWGKRGDATWLRLCSRVVQTKIKICDTRLVVLRYALWRGWDKWVERGHYELVCPHGPLSPALHWHLPPSLSIGLWRRAPFTSSSFPFFPFLSWSNPSRHHLLYYPLPFWTLSSRGPNWPVRVHLIPVDRVVNSALVYVLREGERWKTNCVRQRRRRIFSLFLHEIVGLNL